MKPSRSASPSKANPSWGHQRGWQYWGGQEKGKGYLILDSMEKSQMSEQSAQCFSFPDLRRSSNWYYLKMRLGLLLLHLAFEIFCFQQNSFHSKLALNISCAG